MNVKDALTLQRFQISDSSVLTWVGMHQFISSTSAAVDMHVVDESAYQVNYRIKSEQYLLIS